MHHVKRRGIRYHPPLSEVCELGVEPFDSSLPRAALLHDKSHRGCSILCVMDNAPKEGSTVLLGMVGLEARRTRVTYALQVAPDVTHIGCEFLESPRK